MVRKNLEIHIKRSWGDGWTTVWSSCAYIYIYIYIIYMITLFSKMIAVSWSSKEKKETSVHLGIKVASACTTVTSQDKTTSNYKHHYI